MNLKQLHTLSPEEEAARDRYAQESGKLNAIVQGWSEYIAWDFDQLCADLKLLDSAVAKSVLAEPAVLYSGHGNAIGVIGSLRGDFAQIIGLTYQYCGFISTSTLEEKARRFVETGRSMGGPKVLLEFELPAGFPLLKMDTPSNRDEFEYLIGARSPFNIVDCIAETWEKTSTTVYRLRLKPAVRPN